MRDGARTHNVAGRPRLGYQRKPVLEQFARSDNISSKIQIITELLVEIVEKLY